MSLRCLTWVFHDSDADGFDRLVLLAIADEADDDGGNAYPSQQRIADKAHVSKRSVQRSIDQLERDGELLVERPAEKGRGHVWTYTVLMGRTPAQVEEGRAARLFEVTQKRARKGAERRASLAKSFPTPDPRPKPYESTIQAAARLRERHSLPDCGTCGNSGWVLGEQGAEHCKDCGRLETESA